MEVVPAWAELRGSVPRMLKAWWCCLGHPAQFTVLGAGCQCGDGGDGCFTFPWPHFLGLG